MAAMSINSIPSILKDFAVYVDGIRYAGQVSEIELPKITIKKEDYKVGYMNIPITMGLEPMECTLTLVEQSYNMLKLMGILNNNTGNLLSFRGYQEGEAGSANNNSIEIQMKGIFTELDLGSAKRGDMPSYKYKMSVMSYTYKIDGKPLVIIDPYTNTFAVDGVDQLTATKKALGII